MTSPSRPIELLARSIVNRLEDRGLVEFGDAEEGIRVVTKTLEDNFMAVEVIEQEARQRLSKSLGREPAPLQVEEEMQRIASDRNFVL